MFDNFNVDGLDLKAKHWYDYVNKTFVGHPQPEEVVEFSWDGKKWVLGNYEYPDTDGVWFTRLDNSKSIFIDHFDLYVRPTDWNAVESDYREYVVSELVAHYDSCPSIKKFMEYLYDFNLIKTGRN